MQTQDEALKLKSPEEVIAEYNERLKQEGKVSPSDFVDFQFIQLQHARTLHNTRILQCFQEDTLEPVTENWTEPNSNPNYSPTHMSKTVYHSQRRTFALVGKPVSEVLADAAGTISRLLQENLGFRNQILELENKNKDDKKSISSLSARIEGLIKDNDQIYDQLTALRSNSRKYESDMAKLSKAIGELKLKEILGDSK